MTSLEKPDLVTTNVRYRMPAVHPEGRKFVVIAAAVTLFFWVVVEWEVLGWVFAGLTLWVAAFFRDPIRTTPKGEGLIVAPADGMVTMIATVPAPAELAGEDGLPPGPCLRVPTSTARVGVPVTRARAGER